MHPFASSAAPARRHRTLRRAWRLALLAAVVLLLPAPVAADEGDTRVLCDGQTFDGFTRAPIILGKNAVDYNPDVQKIIRNCTFRNGIGAPGIVITQASNVLITGSTFENIHSGTAGKGQHGIYIRGALAADNITIENSTFADIGGDGIQVADSGRLVTNLTIRGNTFTGHVVREAPFDWAGGENAIDIKGADGPVLIEGNTASGFAPCVKKSGAECTGDPGSAMVIHEGKFGQPNAVTVRGNTIRDNPVNGLNVRNATGAIEITGNTFIDNGKRSLDVYLVGTCVVGNNTFTGTGIAKVALNCTTL